MWRQPLLCGDWLVDGSSIAVAVIVLGAVDAAAGYVLLVAQLFTLVFCHRAVSFGLFLVLLDLCLFLLEPAEFAPRQLSLTNTLPYAMLLAVLAPCDARRSDRSGAGVLRVGAWHHAHE